jgi:hypothetical protein
VRLATRTQDISSEFISTFSPATRAEKIVLIIMSTAVFAATRPRRPSRAGMHGGDQFLSVHDYSPKNRLSATSAAFGEGGIHTQCPKIIANCSSGYQLWLPV